MIKISHILRLYVELIAIDNMNSIFNMQAYHLYKVFKLVSVLIIFSLISQCGLYKKTDARKVPVNAKDRVKKNLEEGRRIKFGQLTGKGSGNFEIASSKEMWRATIDVLDFLPLSSVDYGGGLIITDWYTENDDNNSIKIMVQFLSNEVRADGLKIIVYNKNCKLNNCLTTTDESSIAEELKLAILKKAAKYKTQTLEKEAEEYREKNKGKPLFGEGRDPKNIK